MKKVISYFEQLDQANRQSVTIYLTLILEEQQNINSIQREIYLDNSLQPLYHDYFREKPELLQRFEKTFNFSKSFTHLGDGTTGLGKIKG